MYYLYKLPPIKMHFLHLTTRSKLIEAEKCKILECNEAERKSDVAYVNYISPIQRIIHKDKRQCEENMKTVG